MMANCDAIHTEEPLSYDLSTIAMGSVPAKSPLDVLPCEPHDLRTAMPAESILEKLSELPSSDATIQLKEHDKRVIKRVFRPDFTSDDISSPRKKAFTVDEEYPPPLTCMATASVRTSPQTTVAFFLEQPCHLQIKSTIAELRFTM
ncbi:hypothetical protein PHET_10117 [Paragonimus heterotremus]|uniref:Uncharacterized protein n=1 Tax=Paragonimus heterotremus TaxID=100268 RepID=A0A8J4SJY1_9TREM|nr:hypothetical protein PHET_10117 [Paragonimus heterotremus]